MIRTILAACALLCALTINADARPRVAHPDCGVTMPCEGVAPSARGEKIARQLGFGGPQKVYTPRVSRQITKPQTSGGGTGIVAQARAYIGTNPTGWRRLWCGRFIAMVAPQVAARVGNPNMAKAYLALPRTSGNVGDIAVMGRRGGGHVGIVSGFDGAGNPIIVSGNAGGGIVREGAYARGRIIAFVSAS